jgi:hypothetical protein
MTLVIIVNGEDVEVTFPPAYALSWWRAEALKMTRNFGRPIEAWDVYNNNPGRRLDPALPPVANGVQENDRLFLSLQIGAGG